MFEMDDKKKEVRESVLEKLIDHLMSMSGEKSEEKEDCGPEMEGMAKPKVEMKMVELEAKPKSKFKLSDGSEMEDESLEDILKRKKLEA